MNIKAIPVTGRDLKAGDLFSTVGPEYWDNISTKQSIGERVYIRTETPSFAASDADAEVYKIVVQDQDLIDLLEEEIRDIRDVQKDGDYTDVEVYLSGLESRFQTILQRLKGE